MSYARSVLVSEKDVVISKLNALLVDMARLFLWQTKVVLASMNIIKTTEHKQAIRGENEASSSSKAVVPNLGSQRNYVGVATIPLSSRPTIHIITASFSLETE